MFLASKIILQAKLLRSQDRLRPEENRWLDQVVEPFNKGLVLMKEVWEQPSTGNLLKDIVDHFVRPFVLGFFRQPDLPVLVPEEFRLRTPKPLMR